LTNNQNLHSLQGFSKKANKEYSAKGKGPYHAVFQKFVNYYGVPDYADKFVTAALDGTSVALLPAGTFDFSKWGFDGRSQAAKKGTAYITIAMQILGELENAIESCDTCKSSTCSAIHALDKAVAYYTGSLEGTDGVPSGNAIYQLADNRCSGFKTCGPLGNITNTTSKVNLDIFAAFNSMKSTLATKQCTSAVMAKDTIAKKLFIPMLQGTLRYAWVTDTRTLPSEGAEAEGLTFAASVLPLIHACNSASATTIMTNLRIGQNGTANFPVVKAAFETTYGCLGITCAEVGGVYSSTNATYYADATPCT
jgi:hypothetical protein